MAARGALWRLALSSVVAVILFILVANAIRQPIAAETSSYTASFTDASGLHADADVRVRGVRVGKVKSVELDRRDGQSVALVEFTLDKRYGVLASTTLAIKYQSLTGLRYIDVVDPAETYSAAQLVRQIPTTMTKPSFDITPLFNGLQPVIATLSPDEINTFTENAVAYLSGDGSGLGPLLDSIRTLTRFVADRQQVVATLLTNMNEAAKIMGGNSPQLVQILDWLNRPLDNALKAIDEFRKSELYGPDYTETVVRLLSNIGFPAIFGSASRFRLQAPPVTTPDLPNDIDAALDRAFTNVDDYLDAFKLIPVAWDSLPPPAADGEPLECSQGRFEMPAPMDIFVNGQKVVLCNR
ncbi:MlaD family protein [Mycobacterium sp. 1274756.6]|uniref:MlaD family protein n=1 Tax=Mycobacterium sp. 1274756.6 TaxID=1834076 RepID=UPI000AB10C4C|nr:MlaD family protein [Mycobacterium sp. 1274756.6]